MEQLCLDIINSVPLNKEKSNQGGKVDGKKKRRRGVLRFFNDTTVDTDLKEEEDLDEDDVDVDVDLEDEEGRCQSNEISEDAATFQNKKKPRLSIVIPSRNLGDSSTRINMPWTPSSASAKAPTPARVSVSPSLSSMEGKQSIKRLLPRLSFKSQSLATATDKHDVQAANASRNEKPSVLRSLSFKRMFTPKMRRTSSLPISAEQIDDALQCANTLDHLALVI